MFRYWRRRKASTIWDLCRNMSSPNKKLGGKFFFFFLLSLYLLCTGRNCLCCFYMTSTTVGLFIPAVASQTSVMCCNTTLWSQQCHYAKGIFQLHYNLMGSPLCVVSCWLKHHYAAHDCMSTYRTVTKSKRLVRIGGKSLKCSLS